MCSIQCGISTKIWRLGKDVAALARVWATSFACLRVNSTLELVYKSVNRDLQCLIISPNSVESGFDEKKLSTTILESN
jgi:hypothetical protein